MNNEHTVKYHFEFLVYYHIDNIKSYSYLRNNLFYL